MKTLLCFAAVLLAACVTQQPQPATEVVMSEQITLVKPEPKGGLTINEALQNRRSWREFAPQALTLEELSGVLWAAGGINRPENDHLTAPSALGLYPIRVYAFLSGGVYRYEPKTNDLTRILEGDHRAASGTQPFVGTASLNLVYIADLSVYEGRTIPAEHVRYLGGQDAAGYAENVNLYTAGHGLKSITRGSTSPDLLTTLGLDSMRYQVALAQSVGK